MDTEEKVVVVHIFLIISSPVGRYLCFLQESDRGLESPRESISQSLWISEAGGSSLDQPTEQLAKLISEDEKGRRWKYESAFSCRKIGPKAKRSHKITASSLGTGGRIVRRPDHSIIHFQI